MKIFMYSLSQLEQPIAKEWGRNHHIDIDFTSEPLSEDNMNLANGADGISLQQTTKLNDEKVYAFLSNEKITHIATRSAGFDFLNKEFIQKYKFSVSNVPVYSPEAIAEHALTLSLMLLRNIPALLKNESHNEFSIQPSLLGKEIHELTVGIIGTGHIGTTAAKIFHSLGATVIAYDKYPKTDTKGLYTYCDTLTELLETADIISLHTPYIPENHHLINSETLKMMKASAYLTNTARGPLVDTEALLTALKEKTIAGAGLDTLEYEDLYLRKQTNIDVLKEHPFLSELLSLNNVIITPHVGFYTDRAVRNLVTGSLENIQLFIESGKNPNEIHFIQ